MRSLSILIVDDESANCENLADILELEGHKVVWYESPTRACSEFEGQPRFDLAILDLKMPEMDGVTLLRTLKETQPDLGAILTTAYIDDEEFTDVDRELFEEVLSKPVDIEALIGCVQTKEFPVVICVDDDHEFCDNLQEIFTSHRIQCECFQDFGSAQASLVQKNFDVALLDVRLPDIDGLEAAKSLKKINPEIKSFLVTGYPADVVAEKESIESLGINVIFEKPVKTEELLEAISRIRQSQ